MIQHITKQHLIIRIHCQKCSLVLKQIYLYQLYNQSDLFLQLLKSKTYYLFCLLEQVVITQQYSNKFLLSQFHFGLLIVMYIYSILIQERLHI